MPCKGIIALDIDGTVTTEAASIPEAVTSYLKSLVDDGWQMIFLTGRTYTHGRHALRNLPFPHYVGFQNGAIILEMPSHTILHKIYIPKSFVPKVDEVCRSEGTEFLLFSGYEDGDRVYFCGKRLSTPMKQYFRLRAQALQESLIEVESVDHICQSEFSSFKCFGLREQMEKISKRVAKEIGLYSPVIADPFNNSYCVLQMTHPTVNKGSALSRFAAIKQNDGDIIAAGDDLNDIPLLQQASVAIAMQSAPEALKRVADIIAPPASECGIIDGIRKAILTAKGKKP